MLFEQSACVFFEAVGLWDALLVGDEQPSVMVSGWTSPRPNITAFQALEVTSMAVHRRLRGRLVILDVVSSLLCRIVLIDASSADLDCWYRRYTNCSTS
jgi:hypothetical protein